jgi:hypothetical protein
MFLASLHTNVTNIWSSCLLTDRERRKKEGSKEPDQSIWHIHIQIRLHYSITVSSTLIVYNNRKKKKRNIMHAWMCDNVYHIGRFAFHVYWKHTMNIKKCSTKAYCVGVGLSSFAFSKKVAIFLSRREKEGARTSLLCMLPNRQEELLLGSSSVLVGKEMTRKKTRERKEYLYLYIC